MQLNILLEFLPSIIDFAQIIDKLYCANTIVFLADSKSLGGRSGRIFGLVIKFLII